MLPLDKQTLEKNLPGVLIYEEVDDLKRSWLVCDYQDLLKQAKVIFLEKFVEGFTYLTRKEVDLAYKALYSDAWAYFLVARNSCNLGELCQIIKLENHVQTRN